MYDGALDNMGLTTDPFTGSQYAFGAGNPVTNIENNGHMVDAGNGCIGSLQAVTACSERQQAAENSAFYNTTKVGVVQIPDNLPNLSKIQKDYNEYIASDPNGASPAEELIALRNVCGYPQGSICGPELAESLNNAVDAAASENAELLGSGLSTAQRSQRASAAALGGGLAISAGLASKFVPNPYGKLGGPAHTAKVQELKDYYEAQGFTTVEEKYVSTPGGFKPYRYVDLAVYDSEGNLVSYNQVGRATAKLGIPVMRETQAMSDLFSVTSEEVEINFIAYNNAGNATIP
jgi:hypothetical protein